MTRYERRRNQTSHLWRKRRQRRKEFCRHRNIQSRNREQTGSLPIVDPSPRVLSMQRLVAGIFQALTRRAQPKDTQQQAQ